MATLTDKEWAMREPLGYSNLGDNLCFFNVVLQLLSLLGLPYSMFKRLEKCSCGGRPVREAINLCSVVAVTGTLFAASSLNFC